MLQFQLAIRLLLVLVSFALPSAALGKQIKFVWNVYCPYTCKVERAGQPGYAMEVVQAIFKDSPYQVSFMFVDSWNRAMDQVKSGQFDAIVFSFHIEDVDKFFIYPEQHLAIEKGSSFMVLNDSRFQLSNVESLNQLNNIGVYKNTVWSDKKLSIWEKGNKDKFTYLHGGDVFERALKMLRMRRIDAWEDSQGLLNYNIYKGNISDVRIEQVLTQSTSEGGVLFSRKNAFAPEFATYFSQRMLVLRKSGEFDKILSKYGQINFYEH